MLHSSLELLHLSSLLSTVLIKAAILLSAILKISSISRLRWQCTWPFKMSSHLNWMIIRNNNAFLLKKRSIKKPFSTEPNNLTNLSSYRYSGLVHRKTVGIVDTPDKKGFTVVYKKAKSVKKPAKATVRSTMKAGARRSLHKLKRLLTANKYRVDLTKVALRRASAVLRSQKPLPAKKTRPTKKAD